MTENEAIEILQKIKPIPHRGDSKSTTHILETIALDMAIKALEQTRWMPCTERLPEDYEDVLVCDGVDMFVGWCEFDGLSKKWHSLDDNFEHDTPIIAWMPLPELYRESEDKG